jgi:sterol 14-demethylase
VVQVYGFMKAVFGPDVVYEASPPHRRMQMQSMAKGLRKERLVSYVPKIIRETETFLKTEFGASGEVDILNALSDLTILTASRCLHGDDVRETLFKEVSQLYHDLDQGLTPITYFFPNAPIAAHKKRDAARAEMVRLFSKVIAQRRANPEKCQNNTDILQIFIDMEYKDKTHNTDEQIVGMLIALLFAGQHTSSISSTWTILFLVHNPEIMKRVVHEIDTVCKAGEDITFDHIQQMDLLHNCVKEALRLQPPLIMLMRKVKRDVLVHQDDGKTYTVPKGDTVIVSPALQHRLPEVYKNPDKFDPDRFSEERAEDKSSPFAYIGFGGGRHACIGQNFGLMQVKTIVATLLRTYELEPLDPFPETNYAAMVVGPKGTPRIRYRRRQL